MSKEDAPHPLRKLARLTSKMVTEISGISNRPNPLAGPYAARTDMALYESCLHELAHHIVLEQGWVEGQRTISIDRAISRMTWALRLAHEIDTLAVEHLVAELLGHPLPVQVLAIDAVKHGNLLISSREVATELVQCAVEDQRTQLLSEVLHEEIELRIHNSR